MVICGRKTISSYVEIAGKKHSIFSSWSCGVLLYEIFTLGDAPYANVPQTSMLEYIKKGERLEKPQFADEEM